MIEIVTEAPGDAPAIEVLLDDAFGPNRRMKTAERLREGRRPADGLALVARDGVRLVGTIRLWHVDAGGRPALLLGPVAVRCQWQSRGIGATLIRASVARARDHGHGAVILVGDAPYYGRFGFEREPVLDLAMPGPVELERFLGLELQPGALEGASGIVTATGVLSGVSHAPADARPLIAAAL
ncbi:GNAT family N-acetyltransferase [Lutibaculum baratangense]|uniref:GCN5-related N-acetyltransferase n=1 Tax=Lutibaculum baratangense AMV1 TaxID=631454 RepID=V4R543_9HYPH|nr:N-acetyltransferase [Lutibaculum baratangense]ESR27062.1 GCN5-related N-acetyltransferase [Lutibaculum baratangense AMV1]